MEISETDIGYEIGKWYLVRIDFDLYIPAKFIGFRKPCSIPVNFAHDFPHPGEAIFENVKLFKHSAVCGFEGTGWVNTSSYGRYTSFKPAFREVQETELWAIEAIEKFQRVIAGRQKSFRIPLPNGFDFEGKIKPPREKDNLPGQYFAKLINPKTGKKTEGNFTYDGQSESVELFLLCHFPDHHIIEIKQIKVLPGILPTK